LEIPQGDPSRDTKILSENRTLKGENKKLSERLSVLESESRTNRATKVVEEFLPPQPNPKLTPAEKDQYVSLIIRLGEKGEEEFRKLMESRPVAIVLGETGSDHDRQETNNTDDVEAQVDAGVMQLWEQMKQSQPNTRYDEAFVAFGKRPENKALINKYQDPKRRYGI
jgi:hypothetical protein